MSLDSFKARKTLKVGDKSYVYYSLKAAEKNGLPGISALPFSMKVMLENVLRNEDGRTSRPRTSRALSPGSTTRARRTRRSASAPPAC